MMYRILALFVLALHLSYGQDLYQTLGVNKDAKISDIKKAYRKLAKEHHPDRNEGKDDGKFKEISFAYECLSDESRRRRYDAVGIKGCTDDSAGASGFGDFPFSDFFDIFGSGGGRRDHEEVRRGDDVVVDLHASLEDVYNGRFVETIRSKSVKKSKPGTRECRCRMEMKTQSMGPGRFQMIQQRVCDQCPNFEFESEDREIEVEIEPGMPDGHRFKFRGEGEPHSEGEYGDLYFILKTDKHPVFERRGDDLFTNITINLADALTGFEFEIPHLDGHKVTLKRDKVTWPGSVMRIPNQGMPLFEDDTKHGFLIVTFDVAFPRDMELSLSEKEEVRRMFSGSSKSSEKSGKVTLGVSINSVPDGLKEGTSSPIVYNGLTTKSAAQRHLSNLLK